MTVSPQSSEPLQTFKAGKAFKMYTLMNGVLNTYQLEIRTGEAPCFSKELADSNKVDLSNSIRFTLQLCSISDSGCWNTVRDPNLETEF